MSGSLTQSSEQDLTSLLDMFAIKELSFKVKWYTKANLVTHVAYQVQMALNLFFQSVGGVREYRVQMQL